jgi:hypothetical protein
MPGGRWGGGPLRGAVGVAQRSGPKALLRIIDTRDRFITPFGKIFIE